jgi:arginyl-tRNA synthetase
VQRLLSARLGDAFASLAGVPVDPMIQRSAHADFQSNAALPLARTLGRPPREVAADALAAADLAGLASAEVAGPGFLNLTVAPAALSRLTTELAADPRLGVEPAAHPETVVVDYWAPNIAKEMHAGHLRTAIIGDCLVRVLAALGHDVRRVSHTGDWGTPFGMLLERLLELGEAVTVHELSVGDLDTFYKSARLRFDEDPAFAERARRRVVALQAGDAESLRLWRLLVDASQRYFLVVGDRLGLLLTRDDFVGESFYNDRLDDVVTDLDSLGLLRESDGARCAFPAGFVGREGDPLPLIVRRRDGGYGYQATDLAAIRYRIRDLGANRLLYVIGAPQALHLEMVFAVARDAGWLADPVRAEHVAFGSVLGSDGKLLRSRYGASVKLADLLEEAVARAARIVAERGRDLDAARAADVAEAIGIGAIKYADLSTQRGKDYVFDWDRMLSLTGDTAVYLQIMYARTRSILGRASDFAGGPIEIVEPAERALALALLAYPDAVAAVAETLAPHKLAGHLREIAVAYSGFWDACPVLRAPGATRASRLALCELTGRVLAAGLDLLGIRAPERI